MGLHPVWASGNKSVHTYPLSTHLHSIEAGFHTDRVKGTGQVMVMVVVCDVRRFKLVQKHICEKAGVLQTCVLLFLLFQLWLKWESTRVKHLADVVIVQHIVCPSNSSIEVNKHWGGTVVSGRAPLFWGWRKRRRRYGVLVIDVLYRCVWVCVT